MDLSGPYRKTFADALPHARQVADPFHVIRLANSTIDDVRRRVQNETTGGRGTKHDPLYRRRRLLLAAGDPKGEVRDAWHAKETLRGVYRIPDRTTAASAGSWLCRCRGIFGCGARSRRCCVRPRAAIGGSRRRTRRCGLGRVRL